MSPPHRGETRTGGRRHALSRFLRLLAGTGGILLLLDVSGASDTADVGWALIAIGLLGALLLEAGDDGLFRRRVRRR